MEPTKQQFWEGVTILLNNYHALNRKVFASFITRVERVVKFSSRDTPQHLTENFDKTLLIPRLLQMSKNEYLEKDTEGFIIHFTCVRKKSIDSIKAVGFIDFLNISFRMLFENDAMVSFEIKYTTEIVFNILNTQPELDFELSLRWRDYILKPKFYKWCFNENYNSNIKTGDSNISLRLIDIEKYNQLYNLLKQKYSGKALKLWKDAKESTDPLKFIYEDLAIAAYLITLWQSDKVNKKPTAFADLGCGNGLLVYILIQEGYKGYGYDIRCRKLWCLYPVQVSSQLYEQCVEPFKYNLPAEVDWIIGNHSDELSPWIPVLAATCHTNINFFLLPCCAFEFSGSKFQRRNSSISSYKDFCDYAHKISNVCGFKTEKDRLKIPSTKRNALVGLTRLCTESEFLNRCKQIKQFVENEQLEHPNSSSEEIKLREKIEIVRNCTQIEKSVIESLVKEIFVLLLAKTPNSHNSEIDTNYWQTGGRLSMSDIAKSLDKAKLMQIKSECGGLKTLLRNKHEIFRFEEPDFVLIRKPQAYKATNKPQTVKKRLCFFKLHHPQGCPLTGNECTFIHVE